MCTRGFFPGSTAAKLIPYHQLVMLKIHGALPHHLPVCPHSMVLRQRENDLFIQA
jgi:hypothetical protein